MKKSLGVIILICAIVVALLIGFFIGNNSNTKDDFTTSVAAKNEISSIINDTNSTNNDIIIEDEIIACLVDRGLVEHQQDYSDIPLEIFEEPDKAEFSRVTYTNAPPEIGPVINNVLGEYLEEDSILLVKFETERIQFLFSDSNFDEVDDITAYIIIDYANDTFWVNNYYDRTEMGWAILRGKCSDFENEYLAEIDAEYVGIAYDTLVVNKLHDVIINSRRVFIDFDDSRDSVFETYYYYDREGNLVFGFREDMLNDEIYAFNEDFERIASEDFEIIEDFAENWIDPIEDTYDIWLCYF